MAEEYLNTTPSTLEILNQSSERDTMKLQQDTGTLIDKLTTLESQIVYLEMQDSHKLKPNKSLSGFNTKTKRSERNTDL